MFIWKQLMLFSRKHRKMVGILLLLLSPLFLLIGQEIVFCCARLLLSPIVEMRSQNVHVRIERVSDPPYSHCREFTVSPDGQRFAYVSCRYNRFVPSKFCVVVDGIPMKAHDAHVKRYLLIGGTTWPYVAIAFSGDSSKVKYQFDESVYINKELGFTPHAERLIDLMFLPDRNELRHFEAGGTHYLQLNDRAPIAYHESEWDQAIAVNNSCDSMAIIQPHTNSTFAGYQICRDGEPITSFSEKDWPFVFEDQTEPVYVFQKAHAYNRTGKSIFAPRIPVLSNTRDKHNMINWFPPKYLMHQKAVSLNPNIARIFSYTIEQNSLSISFNGKKLYRYKIDDYPIAFGLEDNPNHLTLFGKRWGALFKIDVFVKESNAMQQKPRIKQTTND